jgi:hypothetical protein
VIASIAAERAGLCHPRVNVAWRLVNHQPTIA